MSKVKVTNVSLKNPVAKFTDNFEMDVSFDCLEPVEGDLEWELVFVGSSESKDCDQVLESVLVGPVKVGSNKFTLVAPPPNPEKINQADLLDCTIMLLRCTYKNQLFVQVGYFVRSEYETPELQNNPPSPPDYSKIVRTVSDQPRVTTYEIEWN
ncbi:hypothetical protein ABK040_015686 [Willaertia magna]